MIARNPASQTRRPKRRWTLHGDYEIGYGKPPSHTRFKKGQSGNPKGRSKGTKNVKTDLLEELAEQIRVREGNCQRRISKQRAVVKSLVVKAVKGDATAARTIFDMIYRLIGVEHDEPPDTSISEDDRAILENFEARILRKARAHGAAQKPAKKRAPSRSPAKAK